MKFAIAAASVGLAFRILICGQHSAKSRERQYRGKTVFTAARLWLNQRVGEEPIQLPIDGVLDLHTFQPRDVKDLVLEYLAECQARGILRVRIIHGKGIGQLRQTVHSILGKHPEVTEFHLASEHSGGWGATIAHLTPKPQSESSC